jgi:hypothetical protein
MIDNNKDQDEWTNSLTLGSKLFRIRIRIRITEPELSLDNQTRNPDLNQKESRSIDRAETENHGAERKESRHESRAEIN